MTGRGTRSVARVVLGIVLSLSATRVGFAKEITVWTPYASGHFAWEAFGRANAAFEKEHPGVRVRMQGNKWLSDIVLGLAGGQRPDVIMVDLPWVPNLALADALMDLGPLMAEKGIRADAFWPASLKACTWNGRLVALPFNTDPNFALFWNMELFAEAGLPETRPPATIQELDNYVSKLTVREGAHIKRAGLVPWAVYGFANSLFTWGWAFGGDFYNEAQKRVTADHPQVVQALYWMKGYHDRYGRTGPMGLWIGDAGWDHMRPFRSGDLAMTPAGPWELPQLRKNPPAFRIGMGPMPYHEATGKPNPTWLGGHALVIPTSAADPALAWEYASFLAADPKGSAVYHQVSGWFPSLRSSELYTSLRSDPLTRPFVAILETARFVRPVIPVLDKYSDELSIAVQAVLNGQFTPEDALGQVSFRVQQALDKALKQTKQ